MAEPRSQRSRPHWHVDAKWVSGLLLWLLLSAALALQALVAVTAERPAVMAIATALAVAFSPNGLDDEAEIAEFRARLRAAPDRTLQPIPGLRIVVREQEIADLSPREGRLYLFRQIAQPFYREGGRGAAAVADDPALGRRIAEGLAPFALFTRATHEALQQALTVLAAGCLALLLPLVVFSYRFGRLFSPGLVLALASLPGAVVFEALRAGLQRPLSAPPRGAGVGDVLGYVAATALGPLVEGVAAAYATALTLGLGLMLAAVVGQVGWWLIRRVRAAGRRPAPA